MDPRQAHDQDIAFARLIRELIFDTIRDCHEHSKRKRLLLKIKNREDRANERKKFARREQRNGCADVSSDARTIKAWIRSNRFELMLEFVGLGPDQARKFLEEVLQGKHSEVCEAALHQHYMQHQRQKVAENDRRQSQNVQTFERKQA